MKNDRNENGTVKFLFALMILIEVLGFTGVLFAPLFFHLLYNHSIEYPLGSVKGIVVDSVGNIYLGDSVYNRIQVYDKNGNFIRGWRIEEDSRSLRMMVDADDSITVITSFGYKLKYSVTGELISKDLNKKYLKEFDIIEKGIYSKNKWETYYSGTALLPGMPSVSVRYSAPSSEKTREINYIRGLIYMPFGLWILAEPYPAFLLIFGGFFMSIFVVKAFYSDKDENKPDTNEDFEDLFSVEDDEDEDNCNEFDGNQCNIQPKNKIV